MTDGATTPPGGGGEGGDAPGNQGGAANDTKDNQAGAGNDVGGNGGEGGGTPNDDGDDWSDPRAAKARFTKLSDLARESQAAAKAAEERALKLEGRLEEIAKRGGGQGGDDGGNRRQVSQNPEPDANDKTKYPLGRDDPQYIEDRALWRVRNEMAEERRKGDVEARRNADFQNRRTNYFAAVDKAKANADTPNAAKQLAEMPPQFTDEIATSEHAALIAEHFATNKAEYDKMLSEHIRFDDKGHAHWRSPASEKAFVRKVASLEASLPGAFAARKQTKAGDVPDRVGGAGGNAGKKLADMDVDELDKYIRGKKAAAA